MCVGMHSLWFSSFFAGFYLISPSEFERFSLSTKWLVEPRCLVEAPEKTGNNYVHYTSSMEKASKKSKYECLLPFH